MPRSKESKQYPTHGQILETIKYMRDSLAIQLIKYWQAAHPNEERPPSSEFLTQANKLFEDETFREKRLEKIKKLAKKPALFIILQQEIMLLESIPEILAELAKFE